MTIHMGLSDKECKTIADGLANVLADTYTLYLKTQNFHWNVTGKHFYPLHELFEAQYEELAKAADLIAERIRVLGHVAPGSYAQFSALTRIKEETGVPDANQMVQQLLHDHETIIQHIRQLITKWSEQTDHATVDLLTERLGEHEKIMWMLRSSQ